MKMCPDSRGQAASCGLWGKKLIKEAFFAAIAAPFLVTALTAGSVFPLNVLPWGPENDGSYWVGLTEGYINGDSSDPFYMYCVDFLGTISAPTEYNVRLVSLNPNLFTGDTMGLTLAQLQTQYLLGLNFGNTPSGNSVQDSDIQQDIWNFTGGTFTPDGNMVNLLSTAESEQAELAVNDPGFFDNAYLLDATVPGPGQQAFMPVGLPSAVPVGDPSPEPSTFLLAGAGLLLYFARRSRFRISTIIR
jgi:hypothetical protein